MDIISYHNEFRTVLFLSSLTLGTFLFTMKSFIIQTIKKEIYDNPRYQKKILNECKLRGKEPKYYNQLKNLARLIYLAITLAFLNALAQISSGITENPWISAFCLLLSASSWIIVFFVLTQVGGNMIDMIDFAEEDMKDKPK